MDKKRVAVFWFRRDLRLEDNCALFNALKSNYPVLPLFIFDEEILSELPINDARVNFIYQTLAALNIKLKKYNSSILIKKGNVYNVWEEILNDFDVKEVFYNKDYEPYAIKRDIHINSICEKKKISVYSFKDHVIFEKSEIVKDNGLPYTVYTPYKNKWIKTYFERSLEIYPSEKLSNNFIDVVFKFPFLTDIGFVNSNQVILEINSRSIVDYAKNRDIPFLETSNYGVYLRFGLLSIRKLILEAIKTDATFLSELIWREFFMQILFHYPKVVNENFKSKYNFIKWRNNEEEFKLWCLGKTGYPIVDAGMRQLNETGYMHNRVRMITASFLCKHLLIDWRWGEAYFAEKLLDFELSSNNGNWQWVAGTGCDSAPYFRVFNPITQQQKFDPNFDYINKWNPKYKTVPEIVDHKQARIRYLNVLKEALQPNNKNIKSL